MAGVFEARGHRTTLLFPLTIHFPLRRVERMPNLPTANSASPRVPRTFESGATRDMLTDKPQYEGYLSPLALRAFGAYMLRHQVQKDGTVRASDNWQRGIPREVYMDSLLRHIVDVWLHHDGYRRLATEPYQDALCGAWFNLQGLLYEACRVQSEDL